MRTRTTIFISVLLILASIFINILLKDSNTQLDPEWIGFFTGFCFGTGILLPFAVYFKKKKS